jgi:hypothetical protein
VTATVDAGAGRSCTIEHLSTGEWRVHADTGRTIADVGSDGEANEPIPDDLTLVFPSDKDRFGGGPGPGLVHGRMVVATFAALGFHEALEWTRLNGRRLAAPHPAGAAHGEMWDWLAAELLDLVDRYAARYPEPVADVVATCGREPANCHEVQVDRLIRIRALHPEGVDLADLDADIAYHQAEALRLRSA